jgi:hypothetical protein
MQSNPTLLPLAAQAAHSPAHWLRVLDDAVSHGAIEAATAEHTRTLFALNLLSPNGAQTEVARLLARKTAAKKALDCVGWFFRPGEVIELLAIDPVTGRARSLCGRLDVSEQRVALLAFICEHNGRWNLYIGINPRRAELAGTSKSGSGQDVVARRVMVLDFDDKDAPPADPQWKRTIATLRGLNPVLVLATGNGTHVWLPIAEVRDTDLAASVGLLAEAMARLGADNTADLPRVMRLPYTVNIPTAAKLRRGAVVRFVAPVQS